MAARWSRALPDNETDSPFEEIFAAGVFVGRYVPTFEVPDRAAPRYMLLLAGNVTPAADGSSRAADYAD